MWMWHVCYSKSMFATLWKKIILTVVGSALALGGAGVAGYKIINKDKVNIDKGLQLVIEVIDGDTFKVGTEEKPIKIRLLGIDSPEKGECFYEESKNFAKELLEGKYVELRTDTTDKDRYDRFLRYAILPVEEGDNIIVNRRLLKLGYAEILISPEDVLYKNLFNMAQGEAKAGRLGMWENCKDPNDTSKLREQDSDPENKECNIKGNISEKGYGKTYLVPGCDNYNSVKIDTKKGEQYFCTEEEAIEAGFRKATNCP